MIELLYPCPTCRTLYEMERHHIRPAAEPKCEVCGEALPVADGDDWLTYRRVSRYSQRNASQRNVDQALSYDSIE